MSINIVTSIHDDTWDAFVDNNPGSNIFHTRSFFQIFDELGKYTPRSFFLEEDGEIIAAIFSLRINVLGSFLPSLSSRSIAYGGVLCSEHASERYLHKHIGKLIRAHDDELKDKVLFSEVRNVCEATKIILPLTMEKYKFVPHLNYLFDLTKGEEYIWNNFSQSLRKSIRRAEDQEIEASALSSGDLLGAFCELVSNTYSRAHIPCFELKIFQRAWDRLYHLGRIRITLANYRGSLVAARAALIYNGRIFDWFAGSNEKGDQLNANALLAWEMMRWGCQSGQRIFDFGGAGDPNKYYGVREFKRRFMGKLVNFGRFEKIYSSSRYAASYLAYNLFRRFLY